MKKCLTLFLCISLFLPFSISSHIPMGITSLDEPLGLTQGLVLAVALWFTAKSDFVKKDITKHIFQQLSVFLATREVLYASLRSPDIARFVGNLPIIGKWTKENFFDPEGKGNGAKNFSNFVALATSFLFPQEK